MLSPHNIVRVYRNVRSRKLKALAFHAVRGAGLRHLVVRMDTINLCNLRCKMCYYSFDSHRKKEQMDLQLFSKIADDVFPRTRFLYLSCATEPLMNKQFSDFIAEAGKYEVPFTSFCTNGQLLTEEVAQSCVEAGISEVIFSIDGATAETYEAIRRGGKWSRLCANLDLLASVKTKSANKGPVVRINFTCMKTNIDEMPLMVTFAKNHGAESLHVRHLVSFGETDDGYGDEIAYRTVFNEKAAETR